MSELDTSKVYRHILIVESRNWWDSVSKDFDPAKDIVFTYDLALQREVTNMGGLALYLDHLVDSQVMQANNFLVYQFFHDWHLDASGEDIFVHRDTPFGFAFRIEIWNDLLSYVLTYANLERLRELKFDNILVGTELGLVESILLEMGFTSVGISKPVEKISATYYFPIHRWMDEKVRTHKFKHRLMRWYIAIQGTFASWTERIFEFNKNKARIFVQVYHPTRKLLEKLNKDPRVKVTLGHFSQFSGKTKYLTERPIPIWGSHQKFIRQSDKLIESFRKKRAAKLLLANKTDITAGVYSIIEKRIISRLPHYLRDLDCIINYLDRHPVQLEIMIANIGRVDTLVDCVCKQRGVPSYLIINGLLGKDFLDEGKYATTINAYSASIKAHYFRGMDNVVCLGDPRMDGYACQTVSKTINRQCPTVTIGASGFNITDLNSYVAVEFEFLWDILQVLRASKEQGSNLRVVIKVRPNGYRSQYEEFANEYFPGVVDEFQDTMPMRNVLEKTDLYISIYSQTLFEASCLGIPSIYYKKDTEVLFPPFDNESELVIIDNVQDLKQAVVDFQAGNDRFDAFLQRTVMEKYVGPLDGKNAERNIDYVYQLLQLHGQGH